VKFRWIHGLLQGLKLSYHAWATSQHSSLPHVASLRPSLPTDPGRRVGVRRARYWATAIAQGHSAKGAAFRSCYHILRGPECCEAGPWDLMRCWRNIGRGLRGRGWVGAPEVGGARPAEPVTRCSHKTVSIQRPCGYWLHIVEGITHTE
jgi:hypothetical protein